MAKTLQDYLGASATSASGTLTVDLNELYAILFPEKRVPYNLAGTVDETIAILLGALNTTSKPVVDENGLETSDPEDAIVSSQSFQPKTFETRGDTPQVKHEFIFNVYTTDNTGFDPKLAV